MAAIATAGLRASDTPGGDTPYAYVTGDGLGEGRTVVSGQLPASFRVIVIGGGWDDAGAAREVDNGVQIVLGAIRDLPGWRLMGVSPDGARDWQGAVQLQADVTTERMIDI